MAERLDRVDLPPLIDQFPVVRIKWVDHASAIGWRDLNEIALKSGLTECYTEARLIKETDAEVTVSHSFTVDGAVADPMTIDKRLILAMETLPKPRRSSKIYRSRKLLGKESTDVPTVLREERPGAIASAMRAEDSG